MHFLAGFLIGSFVGALIMALLLRLILKGWMEVFFMDRATALQKGQDAKQAVTDAATRVANGGGTVDFQEFGDLFDSIKGTADAIAPAPPATGDTGTGDTTTGDTSQP